MILRFMGIMSDPVVGVGEPELFESVLAACDALETRLASAHRIGIDVIDATGQHAARLIEDELTPQVKLELWPLIEAVHIADVMPKRMQRDIGLLQDVPASYLVTLGQRGRASVRRRKPSAPR